MKRQDAFRWEPYSQMPLNAKAFENSQILNHRELQHIKFLHSLVVLPGTQEHVLRIRQLVVTRPSTHLAHVGRETRNR